MKAVLPEASERKICRVLGVARSSLCLSDREERSSRPVDELLAARVHRLIQDHPTFGYRRIWALLRYRQGLQINRKTVYRVLGLKGWFVHQRQPAARPRVRGRRSVASTSNARWATDITHVPCGRDGWGHLTAVIDCHDREIVGYEVALRGRAREAERAMEEACIRRFGTLRPRGSKPIIRSDSGLVFQSRRGRPCENESSL